MENKEAYEGFEDALNAIRERMHEIEETRIIRTFIELKLARQRIKPVTTERMRACLAIQSFNLPITTFLLAQVLGENLPIEEIHRIRGGLSSFLHGLGDKQCLVLKRAGNSKDYYEWMISPAFMKHFEKFGD